jgi:hypothetical protein
MSGGWEAVVLELGNGLLNTVSVVLLAYLALLTKNGKDKS